MSAPPAASHPHFQHPLSIDPLLQAQAQGYAQHGHSHSKRSSQSTQAQAQVAVQGSTKSPRKAHFELTPLPSQPQHHSAAPETHTQPALQHPRPVHLQPTPASPHHHQQPTHHSYHPHQPRAQAVVGYTEQPLPPLPPVPQSPAASPTQTQTQTQAQKQPLSPSFTQRLRFALVHKPTLSRTWEKKSYTEQNQPLSAGAGVGEEGQMELGGRSARSRPTSLYASPADIAAYRPLPMVEGGMTYPYSAPVTPAPPSHV